MWYPDSEYAHSCGGSILDNSTIITIKDCIQLETNPNKAGKFKKLFVMVGSTKVQNGQNIYDHHSHSSEEEDVYSEKRVPRKEDCRFLI